MQGTKKKTWGGAGRGQGRKEGSKRPQKAHSFRIYADLLARLEAYEFPDGESKNSFINNAIEEKLNRIDAIEKVAQNFSDIETR